MWWSDSPTPRHLVPCGETTLSTVDRAGRPVNPETNATLLGRERT